MLILFTLYTCQCICTYMYYNKNVIIVVVKCKYYYLLILFTLCACNVCAINYNIDYIYSLYCTCNISECMLYLPLVCVMHPYKP